MPPQASVLMMGRNLRTRLDLLRPDVANRVEKMQDQQRAQHNQHCRQREFRLGDVV